MKKILIIATLFSTTAFANTQILNQPVQQGFSGPTQGINSVKEALSSWDDTPVTLTGHITASLGGEKYTFNDGTGNITIDVDHDKWFGLQVTPQTKIVLQGEVDKDFNSTSIDVDAIRLANLY
ncbi:YgiW/YdeI family stress tolerance OB fold protein [Photobacterium damselae]|uniref:YgiW/YdeI family stress tolerance OB fold protein n=1 Tax=Photobacterium damselae TaxID=38293 RepID=UPI001EFE93C9|nr:NirD/YgiW/YdeI family stress tolerance protein [Photobacterium damselae]MCG9780410.1 NirD/YgiW/YdeI family stress tolerance protein [Photobacterium damselae]